MKKFLVIAAATTLLFASPAVAGNGGQAVKALNKALHAAGTNLGQVKKGSGIKLGPLVSALNHT